MNEPLIDIESEESTTVTASHQPENAFTLNRDAAHSVSRRFNIPGDVVRKATTDLPPEHRDAILWLHSYGYDNNLSYEEIAEKLKQPTGAPYDRHTVWSVLTGRHAAKKDNFVKAVLDFKRLVEARSLITRLDFVPTRLANKIFQLCEAALTYQRFVMIFGPTQIGKTTALEEFARTHNHGQTTYVRCPEGGRYTDFIGRMARVLRISPQAPNVKDRIIDSFDSQKLLILDEAHQSYLRGGLVSHRPMEFIREIWDASKCGVVICATDVLDQEFQQGSLKRVLEQISQRRLSTLRLPPKPDKRDLNLIAEKYSLAPAAGEALDLQTEIIRDCGLGRWMTILQASSRLAAKRKQVLAWEHVIKAHSAFLELEDPNR